MRKWKTSLSSIGTVEGIPRGNSWLGDPGSRKAMPSFGEDGTIEEADITQADAGDFGVAGGNKEFEWVDWLDEYRKLKEAKLRSEQEEKGAAEVESEGAVTALQKGKGRAPSEFSFGRPRDLELTLARTRSRRV
jgi:serine/threonine-protein kinase RIM15